jgi:DNA repair protein RadA/Sms
MAKTTSKSKSKSIFICQSCGAQSPKWQGRCNDCGEWNSFQEETVQKQDDRRGWALNEAETPTISEAKRLIEENISTEDSANRMSTKILELDRTLGGGVVPGSFILLGGDPGIGKSTLLLQMTKGLGDQGHSVLYVSGEESVQQTMMRAKRLNTMSENVFIGAESNLESIFQLTKKVNPKILIVDSIQTVYLPEIQSAPGTVTQVRECASKLMSLAKMNNITVFLIGHVTKEGNIAGPKVLEHMVDTVLSFEGDIHHQFRLLRALKNRFGTTNELGVFQMQNAGLIEVSNPSEMFLEERSESLQGSAVLASLEGSRALLCEVQALTNSSPMPMPRRTTIGFDVPRAHLILAVLDKHLNLDLAHKDVFVNIVGGLKIQEPAVDLAVAAALISSHTNRDLPSDLCLFGEIGLTGEVRAVVGSEQRIKEAHKLGFKKFLVPHSNKKHLTDLSPDILSKITWIKNIKELPRLVFQTPQKAKAPAEVTL